MFSALGASIGRALPFSRSTRFKNGATEPRQVRDLTTGTATIGLSADVNTHTQVTWRKQGLSVAELGQMDGIGQRDSGVTRTQSLI